jgi:hypothetical protein
MGKKQQQFWQGLRVKHKYLLSSLLAFNLTVFVWSAPAQQTSSPIPTLSPRDELVAKIKGAAERHVRECLKSFRVG